MISKSDWDAYNRAVAAIGDMASSDVEKAIVRWCEEHPEASVAEIREQAIEIMGGMVQVYDDAASALAAEWYQGQAPKFGSAVTATNWSQEAIEDAAHYQAEKLVADDIGGFAKACGEFARNDAMRSTNKTVLANAKKDGVRFARITTGRETCTFCLMLASRGAVYHTRKTAGEFDHWHRNCDCKVVPGFEGDPYAVLVEGHDPMEAYKLWKQFKEIDESGLSSEDAALAKRALLGNSGDGLDKGRQNGLFDSNALFAEWAASETPVTALRRILVARNHRRYCTSMNGDILTKDAAFERGYKQAWRRYRTCKESDAWADQTLGEYARSLNDDALIDLIGRPDLKGKELQGGVWLAEAGYRVTFRDPHDVHGPRDKKGKLITADIFLDGEYCDLKRVESDRTYRIGKRIKDHKGYQGDTYAVDLSVSAITLEEAEVACSRLIETGADGDDEIKRILIMKDGIIEDLKK